MLAVVFGLAWLVAGTHLFRVTGEGVLAVALMVLGAAVVMTARTDWALSRRAWPIWLGAGLLVLLLVTTVAPRFPAGVRPVRIGRQAASYTAWDQLPSTIGGGVGQTAVDLSGLPGPPAQPTSLQVEGIGRVVVRLPANVHVQLDAHVGVGRIFVDQRQVAAGLASNIHQDLDAAAPGPVLNLSINSPGGSVQISQPSLKAPKAPEPTPPPPGLKGP